MKRALRLSIMGAIVAAGIGQAGAATTNLVWGLTVSLTSYTQGASKTNSSTITSQVTTGKLDNKGLIDLLNKYTWYTYSTNTNGGSITVTNSFKFSKNAKLVLIREAGTNADDEYYDSPGSLAIFDNKVYTWLTSSSNSSCYFEIYQSGASVEADKYDIKKGTSTGSGKSLAYVYAYISGVCNLYLNGLASSSWAPVTSGTKIIDPSAAKTLSFSGNGSLSTNHYTITQDQENEGTVLTGTITISSGPSIAVIK